MLKIYSKANCQFCEKAKSLLKLKNVPFEEIRVDLDPLARQFIIERGHRTVPQIYNNDIVIEGGYNGLVALTEQDFQQFRSR